VPRVVSSRRRGGVDRRRLLVGHGTVVLPGATIVATCVGAGSVVTGVLPDFCVAVGNPAR